MSKITQIFKNNKRLDVLYQTSDGICFYTKDSATQHARSLNSKTVVKHSRERYKETAPADSTQENTPFELEANVKDIAKWVKVQTDVDVLTKALEDEQARTDIDPRKGVIEALEAKIQELTQNDKG